MFYGSPDHRQKHHHARQYQMFDSSNDDPVYGTLPNGYPVYATTLEPMPFPGGQQYQYGNPTFNKNHVDYVPEEPRRFRVVEHETVRVPVHANANKKKVEENVDAEAEQFIQHEHKKFLLSKLVSQLSG